MKNFFALFLFFILPVLLIAQEAPALEYDWDKGFSLKTKDSVFSLGFGGDIWFDHAYFFQDKHLDALYEPLETHYNTQIRKARIYFRGQVYQNIEYVFQVDFAGDKTSIKSMYIGLTAVSVVQHIRIGHQNEPFRYSSLTSSKFSNFMDRAPNNRFSPKRNMGILVLQNYLENRLSSQIGIFANAGNISNTVNTNDGYAITARITGLPLYEDDGRHLLHFGMAYSYRNPKSNEYRIKVPVTSNLDRIYTDTDLISDVKQLGLVNFEVVYFNGPLTIQSEYLISDSFHRQEYFNFSNIYSEISYSLTGDRKIYRGSYSGTGKTPIKTNYGKGIGSWEVAAGYSHTDLRQESDEIIQNDLKFGINWYLNPAMRVMLNYIHSTIKNEGVIDVIQGRIQIGF